MLTRQDAAKRSKRGCARSSTTLFAPRRGESLGTDSRVLRFAEAVSAPFTALRCNFFSPCGFRRIDVFALATMLHRQCAARMCATTKRVARHRRSPHFIGISTMQRNSSLALALLRRFFVARLPMIAPRMRLRRAAAQLHTKLSRVTVIFFLL